MSFIQYFLTIARNIEMSISNHKRLEYLGSNTQGILTKIQYIRHANIIMIQRSFNNHINTIITEYMFTNYIKGITIIR